jgi:hypothetical protein
MLLLWLESTASPTREHSIKHIASPNQGLYPQVEPRCQDSSEFLIFLVIGKYKVPPAGHASIYECGIILLRLIVRQCSSQRLGASRDAETGMNLLPMIGQCNAALTKAFFKALNGTGFLGVCACWRANTEPAATRCRILLCNTHHFPTSENHLADASQRITSW